MSKKRWRLGMALILSILLLPTSFCRQESNSETQELTQETYDLAAEQRLLDETLRIDISSITVYYDLFPDQKQITGNAFIVFRMRPGQTLPLIHFDPALRGSVVDACTLDFEPLSFANSADVKVKEFSGTSQKAFEFQRQMTSGEDHELGIEFHLPMAGSHPRFFTNVNDLIGRGNEELFPTINSPSELARHRFYFHINGSRPYACIGSGQVGEFNPYGNQSWLLDTQREVSSYTVLFVLVPAEDVILEERTVAGVPVTIASFRGGPSIADAWTEVESCLPDYIANIGPYPAPHLSIFLARSGGMEYYGGTISAIYALKHEIFHNYFACSAVARTYRDSWWDEAMATWYADESKGSQTVPMLDDAATGIVSNRTPTAMGWDYRAYHVGSQILQATAQRIGGSDAFVRFLSTLHQTHSFQPFNVMEMADMIQAQYGVSMHALYLRWLYSHETPGQSSIETGKKTVDISAPWEIGKVPNGEK